MQLSVVGVRDPQLVRSDWEPVGLVPIEGVQAKSVTNVLTSNGALTEIWRADWQLDPMGVGQVFQRILDPGATSAWHVHLQSTDRLACALGQLLIVMFDARCESPTHGKIAEYRVGARRPATVVVPPGVYHGVRNIGTDAALLVNVVDQAYDYESPDHLRVAADTADIPYVW